VKRVQVLKLRAEECKYMAGHFIRFSGGKKIPTN
jgi:hypothetical protein